MTATVRRAARTAGVPVKIDEIDISTEAELEARYGLEIPVLLVNGRKAAKYRVGEDDVVRMLRARADELGEKDERDARDGKEGAG
jgi:hypothetical protein